MAEFFDSVDRDHQQNQPATIGDFNRADLFYTNRSAIEPRTFEREDFAIHPVYYDLVSRGKLFSWCITTRSFGSIRRLCVLNQRR